MPKGVYKRSKYINISLNSLKNLTYSFPKGNIPWNKGKKLGIGKRNGDYKNCEICNKEYYIKKSQSNKRRTCSIGCASILKSQEKSKENHPMWKGGSTPILKILRHSQKYNDWRNGIYRRDRWTCRDCGKKCDSREIIAHHIKSFSEYPELRFSMDNGITLCRKCHIKLHYPMLLLKRINKLQNVN